MHTLWQPRSFLIPEDELVDELCTAAYIYRIDPADGTVGYTESTMRQVTAEVTWIIFHLQSNGGRDSIPPIPINLT